MRRRLENALPNERTQSFQLQRLSGSAFNSDRFCFDSWVRADDNFFKLLCAVRRVIVRCSGLLTKKQSCSMCSLPFSNPDGLRLFLE